MSSQGFLWLAVISAFLWVAIWKTSRHPNLLTGRNRALRNHLKEFNNLWGALIVYYAIQYLWPEFSAAKGLWDAQRLLRYVPPILAWHLMVAMLLVCANLWLRRASLELELSDLPGTEGRTLYPATLSLPMQRLLKFMERYIALAFIAAVVLLISAPLFGDYAANLTTAADECQVIITSALFVSLAFAYSNILRAPWLTALAAVYAALQLPYSLWTVPGTLNTYSLLLALLKMAFAATLCITVYLYARAHPKGRSDEPEPALKRVAKRFQAHALQQPLFQLVAATTAAAVWVLIYSGLYSFLIDTAAGAGYTRMSLGILRLILTVPFLLGLQYLFYLIAARLRFRVPWASLGEQMLTPRFTVSFRPSGELDSGLHEFTVRRPDEPAGANGEGRTARQVILLHGLFHYGASAWGLLPLLLLGQPDIVSVHVVSYSHGLLTDRTQLDTLARNLRNHFTNLIVDFAGRTVIIGHSLGAILALKMLPDILLSAPETQGKLHHLCLVGPPLLGSRFAKLAFPYPWSRILGRRSSFLADILRRSAIRLPPVGPEDGERPIPALSLILGTRDQVVGNLIQFTMLPAETVEAPAFHGLGMAFSEKQELTRAYFRALMKPDRSEVLARRVARTLGLRGEGGILRFVGEGLADALVVGEQREETLAGNGGAAERPLANELERQFSAVAGVTARDWQAFWHGLLDHARKRTRPTIITAPWPDGRTLVLYVNRLSGCYGLCQSTSPPQVATGHQSKNASLGPVTSLLHDRFPALHLGAAKGVLGETCEHLDQIRSQGVAFSALAARAVIDRDGTYYGVYSLRGVVTAREGVSRLLVHIGAARSPRVVSELDFSAFEENRYVHLPVVEQVEGPHCYFMVLEAGKAYNHGEPVALRMSFRQRRRVSLTEDVDCYRLQPVLQQDAVVSIVLQFPDQCRSIDGFVIDQSRSKDGFVIHSETPVKAATEGSLCRVHHVVAPGDEALVLRYSINSGAQARRLVDLVTIREASEDEVSQVAGMESILAVGPAASKDEIERRLRAFREGLIVACIDDRVVGYVDFIRWHKTDLAGLTRSGLSPIGAQHTADGKYAFVWFLAVLPAFRGKGIARALMNTAAQTARLANCSQLQMAILPENRLLFEAMGFDLAARLENYLPERPGLERAGLLMKRSLVGLPAS